MIDEKTERTLERSIKGLMAETLERIESRQNALRSATEFADATPAEAKLFAALRGRSRSISALARGLGISRQAVHRTVHRLVEREVVRLEAAPGDRREKLVVITEAGTRVRRMAAGQFLVIEQEMAEGIGRADLERLRELLRRNLDVLRQREESDAGR